MKDRIIDCLAYEGRVSIKCINSTNIVEEARKLHDLSPTASAALGRLLTITSIMGHELKSENNSITNQIKGDGPIGMLTAVGESNGDVKGYVANPTVDIPLNEENGKLDVGNAVGKNGMLYIVKDLGVGNPYVGMTPIISGEIAEDFTNYFATSEQTPSVVALGVLVDKNGIRAAGGYKLSLMPDATEQEISIIENRIKEIPAISKMLDENKSLEDIAKEVTGDKDIKILSESYPEYKCNCSKGKCEKGLIAIGKEELEKIINEEEKIEIVCNFCNNKYSFTRENLKELLTKIKG